MIYALLLFLALLAPSAQAASSPSPNALIERAQQINLAQDKQWIDLLHIRPNAIGLKRSQVVGSNFFLSPNGYKDAAAELEATLLALHAPTDGVKENEAPLCRFPARKRWLQDHLQIPDNYFARAHCPLYDLYLHRLQARSVSVVFSSYYAESPGSAFGHTLFRISKEQNAAKDHNELLDYGIGFAVDASPSDNPIFYALGGLIGAFTGSFANVPFYYKVREYSSSESRDVWAYDLALTPLEIAFFVDHVWEVGGTTFGYYFFTQNCGLHILTVLEAAVPRLHLVDRVPLWVIPADTVRAVAAEPGLVDRVTYRPSLRSRTDYEYSLLTPADQARFVKWTKTHDKQDLGGDVHLIDLAMDYFDYKNPDLAMQADPKDAPKDAVKDATKDADLLRRAKVRQDLLITRAQLGVSSETLVVPPDERKRPEQGHRSSRMELALGTDTQLGAFADFDFRFALHDLLDPEKGYPLGSNIEFMNFRFRSYRNAGGDTGNGPNFQLQEFDFFNMAALAPRKLFESPVSWKARISAHRVTDFSCRDCLAEGINFAAGGTWSLSESNRTYFFALLEGDALTSTNFSTGPFRVTLGPSVNLRVALAKDASALMSAKQQNILFTTWQSAVELSAEARYHISDRFSAGLEWKQFYYSSVSETQDLLSLYLFL